MSELYTSYVYYYKNNYFNQVTRPAWLDGVIWDLEKFPNPRSDYLQRYADIYNSQFVKNIYSGLVEQRMDIGPIWTQFFTEKTHNALRALEVADKSITPQELYTQNTNVNTQGTSGRRLSTVKKNFEKILKLLKASPNQKDIMQLITECDKISQELNKIWDWVQKNKKQNSKVVFPEEQRQTFFGGKTYTNYINDVIKKMNYIIAALQLPGANEGFIFENNLSAALVEMEQEIIDNTLQNILSVQNVGSIKGATYLQQGSRFIESSTFNLTSPKGKNTGATWVQVKKDEYSDVKYRSRKSNNTLDSEVVMKFKDGNFTFLSSLKAERGIGKIKIIDEAPLSTFLELQDRALGIFLNTWTAGRYILQEDSSLYKNSLAQDRKFIKNQMLPYLVTLRGLTGYKYGNDQAIIANNLVVKNLLDGGRVHVYSMKDLAENIKNNNNILTFKMPSYLPNNKIGKGLDFGLGKKRSQDIYLKLHSIKITAHLNLNGIKSYTSKS